MTKKLLMVTAVGLAALLVALGVAYCLLIYEVPNVEPIRVACVGDSLTQSSEYPYDLWNLIGNESYLLHNFGVGARTVSLQSETPYMNTSAFQEALDFQPDIVIIMLGTNDAQPSLHQFKTSFVSDYVKLISAFQALPNNPKIWVVLPPPIISNQSGAMDSAYFQNTIIPAIKQAANETSVPLVDVFSASTWSNSLYIDGVHINSAGAKVVADTIYRAIFTKPSFIA